MSEPKSENQSGAPAKQSAKTFRQDAQHTSVLYMVFFVWYVIVNFLCLILMAICLPICILIGDKDRKILFKIFFFGGWLSSRPFIKTDISGVDVKTLPESCIFVANHLTTWDQMFSFCIGGHGPFHAMMKEEIFKIPFFGFIVKMLRMVPIYADKSRNPAQIEACKQYLRDGSSLFIFPEGTRWWVNNFRFAKEGKEPLGINQLGPFFDGAFKIALEMNKPIVPICFESRHIFEDYPNREIHPGTMHLLILDPIYPEGKTLEQLKEETRAALEGNMHRVSGDFEASLKKGN